MVVKSFFPQVFIWVSLFFIWFLGINCKKEVVPGSRVPPPSVGNIRPVADAGPDSLVIIIPASTSTLVGRGSDADGHIVSYLWKKLSGPAMGQLVSPQSDRTLVIDLVPGVYKFELVVKDNLGLESMGDKITVIVRYSHAPLVNAGNDTIIQLPAHAFLNGTVQGLYNPILRTTWRKCWGPVSHHIQDENNINTIINNLEAGLYRFELSVTDVYGLTGKDSMSITVIPATSPPGQVLFYNLRWEYDEDEGYFVTKFPSFHPAVPTNYLTLNISMSLFSNNNWEYPVMPIGSAGTYNFFYKIEGNALFIYSYEWHLNEYISAIKVNYTI